MKMEDYALTRKARELLRSNLCYLERLREFQVIATKLEERCGKVSEEFQRRMLPLTQNLRTYIDRVELNMATKIVWGIESHLKLSSRK